MNGQTPAGSRHRHAESVGDHMVTGGLVLQATQTVEQALARLRASPARTSELVLVTTDDGRLAGAIPLADLFSADGQSVIGTLADHAFPRVRAEDEQETAASLALHHGVDALPVVDVRGRPVGVMPSQALLQVLRREHVEDLHRLAGIHREVTRARHAIEDPPLRRARHRLPWLLVGFAGSALTTVAMASFEHALQAQIAVAFFVPGIVYLADAIGTQSEAIAVRGLSLTRSGIGHLLSGELRTGMLIGLALALLALPLVWLAFGEPRLAVAVSAALFFAGSFACLIGFGLPWLLARGGIDPAYGSGPLATILQDLLSLLVYMGIAQALLF